MRFTVVLAALAACGAMAIDCDHLQEPERTACLDKAAEQNLGMFPVPNHAYAAPAPDMVAVDPYGTSDDDAGTDDIMGDLGEGAGNSATASASSQAKQELNMADAVAQGMYNEDVKVARAFSDLTDSMDDLRHHMGDLHTMTLVDETAAQAEHMYDAEQGKVKQHDLGEGASINSEEVPEEPMGVLDATAEDLTEDLTAHISHKADELPATDSTVDDLLKSMDSTLKDHQRKHGLDNSPEFRP